MVRDGHECNPFPTWLHRLRQHRRPPEEKWILPETFFHSPRQVPPSSIARGLVTSGRTLRFRLKHLRDGPNSRLYQIWLDCIDLRQFVPNARLLRNLPAGQADRIWLRYSQFPRILEWLRERGATANLASKLQWTSCSRCT